MRQAGRIRWVILVAGLVLVSACGKEGMQSASAVKDASALRTSAAIEQGNSAYCNALSKWIAYDHFKVGGEGEPGAPEMPLAGKPGAAAANKAYRDKYRSFAADAVRLAPPELKTAWKNYYAVVSGALLRLDEKFHYVFTDPKYQAVMNDPPAEFMKGFAAFDVIGPYENKVCGNGFPEPAEKKYKGSATSAFCREEKRGGESFQAVIFAGTNPAAVEALVTSPKFATGLAVAQQAPSAIRSDAVTYAKWTRAKWVPLVAKYGYDLPKLVSTGTSVERHALNSNTPDVAAVYSRIEAYDSEVCHV